MIFDGTTGHGARYANNVYKASDCTSLFDAVIVFKSRERAKQEVKSIEEKASNIVARSAVINHEGEQIGDRVVLQFEATADYKAHAEVAWNTDRHFHSVTGPSLDHVLEFEKALTAGSGRISGRIDDVQRVSFNVSETRDGRTHEGLGYSEKQFRSSDCETSTVRTEYFRSPAHAQEEMVKKLKESTTIIERGSKFDARGQQVGERAVAMFKATPKSEYLEDTVIMWTTNSEFHSIKGLFTHVMELEKRNYRHD